MRHLRWFSATALLALCLIAPDLWAEDDKGTDGSRSGKKVHLRWTFEKGDIAYLSYEQDLEMRVSVKSVGEEQEKRRTQTSRAVLEVRVAGVEESGAGRLRLRYIAMNITMEDDDQKIHVRASLDDKGSPKVSASVEMVPGKTTEMRVMQRLLEQLVGNMMKVEASALVSTDGRVRSSRLDGDPFADLDVGAGGGNTPGGNTAGGNKADSEAAEGDEAGGNDADGKSADSEEAGRREKEFGAAVAMILKELLEPDEMISPLLAETFVQLPRHAVAVGDTWKTRRSFTSAGLRMSGTGAATLTKLDSSTGLKIAKIEERLEYDVDTSAFEKRLVATMNSLFRQLGDEFAIDFEFEGGQGYRFQHEAEFDYGNGRTRQVLWRNLEMQVEGKQRMKIFGREVDGDMRIRMRGSATVKYAASPPPGVTVPPPVTEEDAADDGTAPSKEGAPTTGKGEQGPPKKASR